MVRVEGAEPIYEAADLFRQRVLVDGRSFLWPEQEAWTEENISAVFDALLIQKPEGTASFLTTLETQLAGLPNDAIRLAADVYAFYWLFPQAAAVSGAKKIQSVQQIASWRRAATAIPVESHALLNEVLGEGIGLPGQYFLLYQWEYLRFFLAFFRAIRRGAATPFDSEACRQLVYRVSKDDGIKSHGRHILLHLLFPDDFEWTATTSQKEHIIAGFPEAAGEEKDLDLALRKIRTDLVNLTGNQNLDFYDESVRRIWDPEYASKPNPKASDVAPPPGPGIQYWKVTAGAGGRLWPAFRDEGIIAAEWPAIGDLRGALNDNSKDDLRTFLSTTPLKDNAWSGEVGYATNQLWSFWVEMRTGDRVVACDAKQTLAVGTITGDYGYEPADGATAHRRAVTWENELQTRFSTFSPNLQTLMAFNANIKQLTAEQFNRVVGLVPPPPPPFNGLVTATFMDRSDLVDLIDLLHDKKQLILEGPPGSGKTWLADKLARYLTQNPFDGNPNEQVELVQFHQSYGYEDFVQGIRPITDSDGKLTYRVVPGVFTRFCRTAASNPGKDFVLIIDEINRGNLSRIFGELLLLLEYREKRVRLPYGTEGTSDDDAFLSIPPNLYVIGTMNSTDRSLALIDYALRRRFYFHRLLPMSDGRAPVLSRWLETQGQIEPAVATQIAGLFVALNIRIQQHLTPDFQIGHSYFMRADIGTKAGMNRVWDRAIRPLLEEYFHGSRSGDQTLDSFRLELLLPALTPQPVPPTDVGERT